MPYEKADLREEREREVSLVCITAWCEEHSEELSDGVRCGLSLVALELALCVVELAIVCSSW